MALLPIVAEIPGEMDAFKRLTSPSLYQESLVPTFPTPLMAVELQFKGSGPPVSQELVYVRDSIQELTRTLVRIYVMALPEHSVLTKLWDVLQGLAQQEDELTSLANMVRARERVRLTQNLTSLSRQTSHDAANSSHSGSGGRAPG